MEVAAASLAALIGSRVRAHRQSRGWTLDALARAAGVSRRMVVSVERGEVNPSVGTLLRLAEALGVGLPTLVEPAEPRPVSVTRSGDGPVLWTGPAGGRGVLVAAAPAPDVVELWQWTLKAGEARDSEAHRAGARELLHVTEGTLTVDIAGQKITLHGGDAAAFPGDLAHRYANPGRACVRFALAVYEPTDRRDRR